MIFRQKQEMGGNITIGREITSETNRPEIKSETNRAAAVDTES